MNNQMRHHPDTNGEDGVQLAFSGLMANQHYECFVQDFRLPACYNMSKPKELPDEDIKTFSDSVLFYIFYNMPNDRA
jgi:hypothetical protein